MPKVEKSIISNKDEIVSDLEKIVNQKIFYLIKMN